MARRRTRIQRRRRTTYKRPLHLRRSRRSRHSRQGGSGCGSSACPIAPFSWHDMNRAAQMAQSSTSARGGGGGSAPMTNETSLQQSCGVTGCNAIFGTTQNGGRQRRAGKRNKNRKGKGCGCSLGLEGLWSTMTSTRKRRQRKGRRGGGDGGDHEEALFTSHDGGGFYRPPAPIPGPMVGSPWGPSISTWPSVDGVSGNRNYIAPVGGVVDNDPSRQMQLDDSGYGANMPTSMVGGYFYPARNSSRRSRNTRGGGISAIPQMLEYGVKSVYNTLHAEPRPVNPLPYKDQLPVPPNRLQPGDGGLL